MDLLKSANKASSAITLSMEVSYPFHSHLIGRSGQNVNQLMEQSGTRIHFPDTNRVAGHLKSNTVVVRGAMAAVENVRQRIRKTTPIEFVIECRIERIGIIGQEKLLDHFSTVYGVLLRFYPKIDGINCQVNIRGQQELFGRLKEAVQQFCFLTQNVLESVVMKMETSFDHVWLARDHVESIITKSGAGIRLPDVTSIKELPKKYSVWIRGSMDAVQSASLMLSALLPLQVTFQATSGQLDQRLLAAAAELDVLFQSEPSNLDSVTIRLTSYERNARSLYELVRLCWEMPISQGILPNMPPTWKDMSDTNRSFLPASKKLHLAMSSNNTKPPASRNSESSDISGMMASLSFFESIPTSSHRSSPTSTSSSSLSSSTVPASLSASRFDVNSFRQLSQLLETIGLTHYTDLFMTNEVDFTMFTTLNDADLVSIGISSFGARKIMMNAIHELRR